jgi:hypothetical protein
MYTGGIDGSLILQKNCNRLRFNYTIPELKIYILDILK